MSAAAHAADRIEIAELFAKLANLLDDRRHGDAPTVYADDVVARSPLGGELRGVDEVTAYLERSWVDDVRTQHVHGDVLIRDLEGDRATATANQVVYFHRDGEAPHRTSGLRVSCTAVRTAAGWRFRAMDVALAWMRED